MHPEKARKTKKETLNRNIKTAKRNQNAERTTQICTENPKNLQFGSTCKDEEGLEAQHSKAMSIHQCPEESLWWTFDKAFLLILHHAKCNLNRLTDRQPVVLCCCYTPSVSSIRKKNKQLHLFPPLVIPVTFFVDVRLFFGFFWVVVLFYVS